MNLFSHTPTSISPKTLSLLALTVLLVGGGQAAENTPRPAEGTASTNSILFPPVQKKYIGHGWDLLAKTPEEVLAHAADLDQTGLDGVTLMVNRTLKSGRKISHTSVMNDPLWPRDELNDLVDVFRKIVQHRSLRESFVSSWWAPQKRLAWTDDAAWANFATNMGTVAWLAKKGGLRGILVDAEDYPNSAQYTLKPGDPPYDTAARLARQRGAEVFRAIFKEYPDVTFLSFWLLSLDRTNFNSAQPMAAVKGAGDLWPWFVNGMLDVLPPTARFVDGNEFAYGYEAEKCAFYRSACQQRTSLINLVAPENRQKYLGQLRAGFGLYLDSYINPSNSPWYFAPIDGSRLNHFRVNLTQATEAADEYIWIYGEKRAWIHWTQPSAKPNGHEISWDEALPGLNEMMAEVKDPFSFLHARTQQLRASGKLVNLVDAIPKPWAQWQDDQKPFGKLGFEGDAAFLEGAPNGCHLITIPGKTGELFGVRLNMRGVGGSSVVYFQKDGRWQWQISGVTVLFEEGPADKPRAGEALVRMPQGANHLVLMLSGHQQPGEKCWFDSVEIYRLHPEH